MTHKEFRRKQAEMDEAGLITHIRTIRLSKSLVSQELGHDDRIIKKYRYKYRYEVILNGKIIANVKSRRTAKKRLLDLYEEKMVAMSI